MAPAPVLTHHHWCPWHSAVYDCQCAESDEPTRICGPCLDGAGTATEEGELE